MLIQSLLWGKLASQAFLYIHSLGRQETHYWEETWGSMKFSFSIRQTRSLFFPLLKGVSAKTIPRRKINKIHVQVSLESLCKEKKKLQGSQKRLECIRKFVLRHKCFPYAKYKALYYISWLCTSFERGAWNRQDQFSPKCECSYFIFQVPSGVLTISIHSCGYTVISLLWEKYKEHAQM